MSIWAGLKWLGWCCLTKGGQTPNEREGAEEDVHLVTIPCRWTRACIPENVCETKLPIKILTCACETYIWSSYPRPFLLGCQTFYTNFYRSPPAVICSLVNVEIDTICRRCRQGTEDAMFLLLPFLITSVILAITWPPRKCFECHILLLSLTSRTHCYMWSSLWWLISATVPLFPTKLLMMPRCLTSCCYWEQNNFKYDHLIWVSKRQQTHIIKREREKKDTSDLWTPDERVSKSRSQLTVHFYPDFNNQQGQRGIEEG